MLGTLVPLLCIAALAAPPRVAAQDSALRIVRGLSFVGNHFLSSDRLAASIATTNSDFFATWGPVRWLGLGSKREFDEDEFVRDVLRLKLLYRVSGFPAATVDTTVRRVPSLKNGATERIDVYVAFRIVEGEPIRVTDMTVTGLDSLAERERGEVTLELPLRVGDPFDRTVLQASIDTIATRLRNRGYPKAEVFREFTSDAPSRRASVTLNVVTGTLARYGPLRVQGNERVDSQFVRALLATKPGRTYVQDELFLSQRSLYASDLFRFASVQPDTTAQPSDSIVPLLASVTEAPRYRLRSGVGYGTTDCFRASSAITVRNFLGGGRLLDVSARASKLGVGNPTDVGLANSFLCRALQQDTLIGSRQVNYNLTASYRRPAFLGSANTLTLSVFTERRSEYKVYLREDVGSSLTFTRENPRKRIPITLTYAVSYGRTQATPATFCSALSACTPDLIGLQQQRRVLGTLTGTIQRPRTNNPLDPSRGSNLSFEVTHSDTWLGSSSLQRFTRLIADAAFYRPLGKDVVLSWRVRGGIIFAPTAAASAILGTADASFVPLDQRFYGGGPNDVRGYQRNELGPIVYVVQDSILQHGGGDLSRITRDSVQISPTGGNTLAVGNVELRFPSPVLPSRLRIAAFVDAGTVWQRGLGNPPVAVRVTPGIGLRFATPLGPVRFDAAYSDAGYQQGRLFAADSTNLRLVTNQFSVPRGNFTFHLSVGQAF